MSGSPLRLNLIDGLPCNFEGYRFFKLDSIFLRLLSVLNSRYDTFWRLFCQIIEHEHIQKTINPFTAFKKYLSKKHLLFLNS